MRDFQRSRVYSADLFTRRTLELAAKGDGTMEMHNSTIVIPQEIRFGSLAAVEQYIRQIQHTGWYVAQGFNPKPVSVRRRAGDAYAHYDPARAEIAMHEPTYGTPWSTREIVVLHELAHHVTPHGNEYAAHGPEFVGNFLALVREFMGPEVWMLLYDSMLQNNVKITTGVLS